MEETLERTEVGDLENCRGSGKRRTHCNTEEWLNVMDVAHTLGIPTTATMMFGTRPTG